MNIIWITIESILPANTGGRIGIFKRLEQISKNNSIFLYYTMDNKDDIKYEADLKKYCKEVHGFLREGKSIETLKKMTCAPYTVASRYNKKLVESVSYCLKHANIDLINVDSPHMGLNLLELNTDIPIVLNQHNIEWMVYKNVAESSKNLIKKALYTEESLRFKLFEKKLYERVNVSLFTFVSCDDKAYFERIYGNKYRTALVPVGAENHRCSYNWKNEKTNKIIFVGKMSYAPNVEGVIWFATKVLPLIKEKIRNVQFEVIGRDPVEEIKALNKENEIKVVGGVPTVDEYYESADLAVVPLKHGGGVKVKLLEAIGFKIPVITTSVGVQGTDFNEDEIIIADESEKMALLCIDLLKNRNKYRSMYEKLFKEFEMKYTWEAIGSNYEDMLRSVCKKN